MTPPFSLIIQVVSQTISRDLDDINAKVKDAAYNLRVERVRLIKIKVKEVLGKDVDITVNEVNTDVDVNLNVNDLAKTEGIVSTYKSHYISSNHFSNIGCPLQ